MKSIKFRIAILLFALLSFSFIIDETMPAPQSLMVTLTGYRNADNELKCKLFYMTTLPEESDAIKKVRIQLLKPGANGVLEMVSDLKVPFDWQTAKSVEGVISFYTTRNILYIGIGEFDLLRKYECRISFINEKGDESRTAIFKK